MKDSVGLQLHASRHYFSHQHWPYQLWCKTSSHHWAPAPCVCRAWQGPPSQVPLAFLTYSREKSYYRATIQSFFRYNGLQLRIVEISETVLLSLKSVTMSLLTGFDNWVKQGKQHHKFWGDNSTSNENKITADMLLGFFDSREHEHTNVYEWLTSSGRLPGHGQTPAGWRLSLWHPASACNTEAALWKNLRNICKC